MKRCWTSRSSFGGNWSKAWIGTQMPHLLWRCCQRLYGQFPTAQVSTHYPCYCDESLFKMKNLKSRQVCLFNPWIQTCQPLRNEIVFINKETFDPSSNLGKPFEGENMDEWNEIVLFISTFLVFHLHYLCLQELNNKDADAFCFSYCTEHWSYWWCIAVPHAI